MTARWRIPPDSSWGYARAARWGSGSSTRASSSIDRFPASDPLTPCAVIASATWSPMRMSGLSEVMGSW
jgi:hypothetical protein